MVILRRLNRSLITLLGPDEAKLPAAAILLYVGACAAIVTIQTSAPARREINELGADGGGQWCIACSTQSRFGDD